MDKQVREFLESLSNGIMPTVSYYEHERWVTAVAEELLSEYDKPKLVYSKYRNTSTGGTCSWARKSLNEMVDRDGNIWYRDGTCPFQSIWELVVNDPPESPRFHEYYNILTGETARWARDNNRLEMLDEYGHICTSNVFYDKGWRLSATLPPYPGQSDLDALKRQVQSLQVWRDRAIHRAVSRAQRIANLERDLVRCMERVECLEADGRMAYSKVEQLEASSRLETTRLSDLARKLDSLFN